MTLNLSKHWKVLTGESTKEQFQLMIKIILTTMILATFFTFIQFKQETEAKIDELQIYNEELTDHVHLLESLMLHSKEELTVLQGDLNALSDSVMNINNYTEEEIQIKMQEIIQKNIESLEGK